MSAPSNTYDLDRVSIFHIMSEGHWVYVIEETKMHAVRMPLADAEQS